MAERGIVMQSTGSVLYYAAMQSRALVMYGAVMQSAGRML